MKQTQIYGLTKSYKMFTQTSNNEKKGKKKIQRRKHRSIALPWHGGAVGWARSGDVLREEVRPVRASSRTKRNGALLYLKWRDEVKTLIWLKSRWSEHEQERNMWSILTVWDRVSRVIYKNTRVMRYGNWKQPKCVFSFHNS